MLTDVGCPPLPGTVTAPHAVFAAEILVFHVLTDEVGGGGWTPLVVLELGVFLFVFSNSFFLSPNEISRGTPAYKRVKRGTTLVEAEGRTPSFFSRGKSPRRLLDPKTQRKVWIPGTLCIWW